MFCSHMSSVHASVSGLCIRDYMFPQYLQYPLMDFWLFHQTFIINASWDNDELMGVPPPKKNLIVKI